VTGAVTSGTGGGEQKWGEADYWKAAGEAARGEADWVNYLRDLWQQNFPDLWAMLEDRLDAFKDPNWLRGREIQAEQSLTGTYQRATGRAYAEAQRRGQGTSSMTEAIPSMMAGGLAGQVAGQVRTDLIGREEQKRQAVMDLLGLLMGARPEGSGAAALGGVAQGYSGWMEQQRQRKQEGREQERGGWLEGILDIGKLFFL